MTDRVNAITVVLEKDIRKDDIESTVKAICHLRGVLNAEVNIVGIDSFLAEERARSELGRKIIDIIYPKKM